MKCEKKMMRLYAVTDRAWVGKQTLLEQVESAILGGATFVQLREKTLDEETFLQEAIEMNALCKKYGVPFVINDNVEIALKSGADGVHVGQSDMEAENARAKLGPDKIIGVSTHNVEEALAAVKAGADYIGLGAAFATGTKKDANVLPEGMIRKVCDAVDIPVVVIGGIHKENMPELEGKGMDGVALASAIFSAEDIESECKELRALSEIISAKN